MQSPWHLRVTIQVKQPGNGISFPVKGSRTGPFCPERTFEEVTITAEGALTRLNSPVAAAQLPGLLKTKRINGPLVCFRSLSRVHMNLPLVPHFAVFRHSGFLLMPPPAAAPTETDTSFPRVSTDLPTISPPLRSQCSLIHLFIHPPCGKQPLCPKHHV